MPTSTPAPSPVRVAPKREGQQGLLAARAFRAGEVIFVADGEVLSSPSRTSVQIGPGAHIDVPAGAGPDDCPWRYLEHACQPTAAFRGRSLVALRDLEPGDELTFDYETTEWELASPFVCDCGSMGCTGREIRGFRHLSSEERMRRLPQLRDELRDLVVPNGTATSGGS